MTNYFELAINSNAFIDVNRDFYFEIISICLKKFPPVLFLLIYPLYIICLYYCRILHLYSHNFYMHLRQ